MHFKYYIRDFKGDDARKERGFARRLRWREEFPAPRMDHPLEHLLVIACAKAQRFPGCLGPVLYT